MTQGFGRSIIRIFLQLLQPMVQLRNNNRVNSIARTSLVRFILLGRNTHVLTHKKARQESMHRVTESAVSLQQEKRERNGRSNITDRQGSWADSGSGRIRQEEQHKQGKQVGALHFQVSQVHENHRLYRHRRSHHEHVLLRSAILFRTNRHELRNQHIVDRLYWSHRIFLFQYVFSLK